MAKTLSEKRGELSVKFADIYEMHWWQGWKYSILKDILCEFRKSKTDFESYSDAIIMADTETSKSEVNPLDENLKPIPVINYVVAWTISIRCYGRNIVTLYGTKPSDMMHCIQLIMDNLQSDKVLIFFHNLPYDYVFLRKFFIKSFGEPIKMLAVKPHYPIYIIFENGLILKDSLILSQKALAKWADDLQVEHRKAVGKWDYEKIRHQADKNSFTADELQYIEQDTLAGVECIEATMKALNKSLITLPYTATGIPREELRHRAASFKAHQKFKKMTGDLDLYLKAEKCFHGGFVHSNRSFTNMTITKELFGSEPEAEDFASSYPYNLLVNGYPLTRFQPIENTTLQKIFERSKEYCFIFKLILVKPRLKQYDYPMPMLQYSKCEHVINPILDNGRLLGADYVEIYYTEIDAAVFDTYYEYDAHICTDVHYASKGLLPKWYRDYIFELFSFKCTLKNAGKPIEYALSKSKLNSLFGMAVQKGIKADITEDYETGLYNTEALTQEGLEKKYDKYVNNRNSILNFFWGVYCTAYAQAALFELSTCIKPADQGGCHLYSDTDSIYACGWDYKKLEAYNQKCKDKIIAAGYGPVVHNGKEFWLGVAEHNPEDDTYTEFRYQGAKRYAGRHKDGKLVITIAGVPKKTGAECLNNDLDNFRPGFIFEGTKTGKKTHFYQFQKKITKNKYGDEIGDSIDLLPCDYKLDGIDVIENWDELLSQSIELPVYEDYNLYNEGR